MRQRSGERKACSPRLAVWALAVCGGLTLLGAAANVSPSTSRGWILLIHHPALFESPNPHAARHEREWPAGRRLTVLETHTNDEVTSGVRHWYRVRLENATEQKPAEGWLPDVMLDEPPPPVAPEASRAIGQETVDRTHGLSPDYAPTDLLSVGPRQDPEVDYRLRRQAAGAWEAMFKAAQRDGIRLLITSAYRSWEKQQELYEHRLRESGWGQMSVAPPGHSEHQLGTALDLTDGNEEDLVRESFGDTPAGRWLRAHAPEYGFAISYTRHNEPRTGYVPEPWHYRYWGLARARARHQEALGEN